MLPKLEEIIQLHVDSEKSAELEILLTDEKAVDFENNPAILSLKKRVTRLESICRNIVTAGRAGRI